MHLKLLQVGEPVLRQKARELSPEEILSDRTQALIVLMHQTLRDAPGVGLAAPQIGEGIQLAIIEDLAEYSRDLPPEEVAVRERTPIPFHVVVNPRIVSYGEQQVEFFEGCLSLNGFMALVPRSREVVVECLDEHAKPRTIRAIGWYARILQHEIDHLNGMIYIDRMDTCTFASVENYKRYGGLLNASQSLPELETAGED
jgi:peptide deformylase